MVEVPLDLVLARRVLDVVRFLGLVPLRHDLVDLARHVARASEVKGAPDFREAALAQEVEQ